MTGPQSDGRFDIAFAGAGLSATSLALRLAALPDPPRMLLIDPLVDTARDRTWCCWQLNDTPCDSAITHRWHRWRVGDTQKTTTAHSRIPYVRIPSDRFYDFAHKQLSSCPCVTFLRGVSVNSIEDKGNHVTLQLSDGQIINAGWVFDSRPLPNDNAPWRQIFRGLELHSAEANLDPETVTLMDFQSAGPDGIRFFYVLPLDRHTALVEDTWLVPRGQLPSFTDEKLLQYARNNLCSADWKVLHREEGNLPMGLASSAAKQRGRVLPWGTPAGAVRASSGYAFSRIQRASDSMARYWSQHHRPAPDLAHESKLLAWMDRVFIRVMERHPERVPEFFIRMFDRVPPEALIPFLESTPRPADILQVMRALPAAPFLASALR